ncbi:hypothetical protein [Kitasatospora fiedleri]|uniref:hypothetical protein n=1 Tax=Kitasatospora fiedleri TaxID=2991545 RepID=UPI00249B28F4|nr:hypothetical protein [Kitasatospora fiedleri]
MSDPIQPTNVTLGREGTTPPPSANPGPAVPPQPTAPPTAVAPSPSGPGSWWRGAHGSGGHGAGGGNGSHGAGGSGYSAGGYSGGTATMVAPVYVPPAAPVSYNTYNYIVQQAAPPAPPAPRFDVQRIRPVRNGLALAIGAAIARGPLNGVLHVFGDSYGVVLAGLAGALLMEWAWHDHRKLRWLVRVHTCTWVAAGLITPAGLLGLGFLGTGVQ